MGTLVQETKESLVAAVTDGIAQSVAYALVYLAAFSDPDAGVQAPAAGAADGGEIAGAPRTEFGGRRRSGLGRCGIAGIFFAVWLLQRLQLVITEDMVQQSALLQFFVNRSPMDWLTSL